jgi:hypothetical protein
MKLFKTKPWAPLDLACLKWSSILFGMVLGAYLPEFTRQYLLFFIAGIVLLAIRPVAAFFRNSPR